MTDTFGPLNPRTASMRERILDTQPTVCTERAILTTKAYRAHEQEQVILRRAYTLDAVLRGMSIYIDPEALLVGNQASADRAAPIFPEYAMDWVINELDQFDQRDGDRFTITEENKQVLRDIYPYWKGRTLQDKGYAAFPQRARLFYDLGIIKTEGNITSGDAHIAVDYGRVLREGLKGYRARTLEAQEKLDLTDFQDLKKSYFYQAILIVLDAVEAYALRFAELAQAQAGMSAAQLSEASGNLLGLSLLTDMTDGTKNAAVSPLSLQMALSLAREGAAGETRAELDALLAGDDIDAQALLENARYADDYEHGKQQALLIVNQRRNKRQAYRRPSHV